MKLSPSPLRRVEFSSSSSSRSALFSAGEEETPIFANLKFPNTALQFTALLPPPEPPCVATRRHRRTWIVIGDSCLWPWVRVVACHSVDSASKKQIELSWIGGRLDVLKR